MDSRRVAELLRIRVARLMSQKAKILERVRSLLRTTNRTVLLPELVRRLCAIVAAFMPSGLTSQAACRGAGSCCNNCNRVRLKNSSEGVTLWGSGRIRAATFARSVSSASAALLTKYRWVFFFSSLTVIPFRSYLEFRQARVVSVVLTAASAFADCPVRDAESRARPARSCRSWPRPPCNRVLRQTAA